MSSPSDNLLPVLEENDIISLELDVTASSLKYMVNDKEITKVTLNIDKTKEYSIAIGTKTDLSVSFVA